MRSHRLDALLISLLTALSVTQVLAQPGPSLIGTWDARFESENRGGIGFRDNSQAVAIDPSTGDLFVGGDRLTDDAAIVRWTGSGWVSIDPGLNDEVLALAVGLDGTLFAGGRFTDEDPGSFAGVAQYDGNSWSSVGMGVVNGDVHALMIDPSSGDLYVGGTFDAVLQSDGTRLQSPQIARWTGSEWDRVGYGGDGGGVSGVRAIAMDPVSGELFVGGQLVAMRNNDSTRVAVGDIARFDGAEWSSPEDGQQIVTRVNDLVFDPDGRLFVAHEIDGGIAMWDGSEWSTPAGGTGEPDDDGSVTNDQVLSLMLEDNRLYVGGEFDFVRQAGGSQLHSPGVAVYHTDTNAWSALGSGINHPTTAGHTAADFAMLDGSLFVAGNFSEAGGRPSDNIARWSTKADGSTTMVNFRVDMRQATRLGILGDLRNAFPTTHRPMVDVLNGPDADQFFLYDTDGDSVWIARVAQPTNSSISFSYLIDVDADGYNEQDDWVYERGAPAGAARAANLTDAAAHTLPVAPFDGLTPGRVDPDYGYVATDLFQSGDPGRGRFRGGSDQAEMTIDPESVDRAMNVAVRWYADDPGGSPPEGITAVSKSAYWAIALAPRSALYSALVEFEYAPIPGIGAANDLRLLHRRDQTQPWQVMEAEIDVTDEVLRLADARNLIGEWTLGSTSNDNVLTSEPPGVAQNPRPSDGDLSAPVRPLLNWETVDDAATYDITIWPATESEPAQPSRRDLDDSEYQLPDDLVFGEIYNWRVNSININGTTEGPVWSFTVGNVPDLVVNTIDLPENAFSGQPIEVSWTVENTGDGGTNVPLWFDEVFVSDQEEFDSGEAESVGRFRNVSFLNPGEQYANTQTVELPEGIEGTQFIHILADATSRRAPHLVDTDNDLLDEGVESNNNLSASLQVTLTPFADLQVESVVIPSNVFSGDSIDVQYTVTNAGSGRTDTTSWFDSIFLSEDDDFDFNFTVLDQTIRVNEVLLGTFTHDGALEPGTEYTATSRVKLPEDAIGDYTIFVFTDIRTRGGDKAFEPGSVFEFNVELNNWTGDSFTSTLTPPPDLVVTDVSQPSDAESGQQVELEWTVQNQGPGATRSDVWRDAVYLSPSADFDSTTATLLGGFRHDGVLAPDQTYAQMGVVQIPDGYNGEAHFFVEADVQTNVFEHTFEANNQGRGSSPTNVSLAPYPDLQITSVAVAPTQVQAGDEVALTYGVENNGSAPTSTSWADSVYVLETPTWDPGSAVALVGVVHEDVLAPEESSSRTIAVPVPPGISGSAYFFVEADAGDVLFERPDTELGVGRSAVLEIEAYPPVDLAVTFDETGLDSPAGVQLATRISVKNEGAGATVTNEWMDEVFLSLDEILEPDTDLLLLQSVHDGRLDAGAGYEISRVSLPPDRTGDWFLIVRIDQNDLEPESDETNNVAVVPISITAPPAADLRVTSVEAPDAVASGQPVQIQWSVSNEGVDATDSRAESEGWFDAVFLSPDGKLDRNDVLLGTREHRGNLDSGGDYDDTLRVTLPAFASGAFAFLVQTDRRNDVHEYEAEGNNVSTAQTQLTLAEPSDLIVSDITVPNEAEPGDSTTIAWEITNEGDNPARGFMREAVFFSEDETWDVDDPVLGVVEREIDLPPGSSMQAVTKVDLLQTFRLSQAGRVTEILPGLSPGSYRTIVRTDITNTIRETDDGNNTLASTAAVNVGVPMLTPGVAETANLAAGQAQYYGLETQSNQDVRISLTTDAADAGNELYAAFGRTPTPRDSDVAADEPFLASQTLVLPSTMAGTYLIQVLARTLPAEAEMETVQILAEVLGFEIADVSHNLVGQGQATLTLNGGGFRETDRILLRKGSETHRAELVGEHTSTEVTARFMLEEASLGMYDLIAEREVGGQSASLEDAVTIETALPLSVEITERVPDAFRGSAVAELVFEFTNTGNTDVPYMEGQLQILDALNAKVSTSDELQTRSDFIRRGRVALGQEVSNEIDSLDVVRSDNVFVVPLIARNMTAGTTVKAVLRTETTEMNAVQFSSWADAVTENEFVTEIIQDIDDERQRILASPNRFAPEEVALATDVEEFRRDRLEALVTTGLLSSEVLSASKTDEFTLEVEANTDAYTRARASDRNYSEAQSPTTTYKTTNGGGGGLRWPPTDEDKQLCRELGGKVFFAPFTSCGNQHAACDCFRNLGSICFNPEPPEEQGEIDPETGEKLPPPDEDRCPIEACKEQAREMRRKQRNGGIPTTPKKCRCQALVEPCDPNDIIGPDGFGDENWVGVARTLPYTVRFENDPERASAPAQVVQITHPLDADVDARSFRLGDFGFGNFTFSPPENSGHYRDRLDLRDSLGLFVDVTAGIDILAREAFWVLSSVSPETGDQPRNDPFAGFLPINNDEGDGEGFVSYTVKARQDAETGDEIEARASIVFDLNAPIETPAVLNTIDADLPNSRMRAQPFKRDTIAFALEWDGSDTGAGLATYDVYVSRGDGPFEVYASGLSDESLLFVGEENVEYRFFTRATDQAGNREPLKDEADTGVLVPVEEDILDVPTEFALYQNYPNPFNPSTTIPFDLSETAEVEVTVYNVLGQQVLTLSNRQMSAGQHTFKVDLSRFASGLYFYEIKADATSGARFRDVKKMVLVK